MHEVYSRRNGNGAEYTEEIIREDSDMISFRGLRSYLKRGTKKAVKLLVSRLSGSPESLDDKLDGCSVVFETVDNKNYILEVTVHERLHGEEFIVQGNLYAKTNGHFDIDNCIEAPRKQFIGPNSRTSAYVFANNFISETSAKYDLK